MGASDTVTIRWFNCDEFHVRAAVVPRTDLNDFLEGKR